MVVPRAKLFFLLLAQGAAAPIPNSEWSYRDVAEWKWQCNDPGQAPIDIATKELKADPKLQWLAFSPDAGERDKPVAVTLQVTTHYEMVVWTPQDANLDKITWGGKDYFLKQFHFHSPSENTVDGKHFDMEMHNVHMSADGHALVLAVFLTVQDKANPYFESFWEKFPEGNESAPVADKTLVVPYRAFLPEKKDYYYFDGSMTTPPCTTGVNWVVLENSVGISLEQRDNFRANVAKVPKNQMAIKDEVPSGVASPWDKTIGVDNRPVQPLGKRVVNLYRAPDAGAGNHTMLYIAAGGACLVALGAAFLMKKGSKASSREPGVLTEKLSSEPSYNQL